MSKATFQQVHKALQYVTERAADELTPILCKFWDDVPAEAIKIVFDYQNVELNDASGLSRSVFDNTELGLKLAESQSLPVRLLAEKPKLLAVLRQLASFRASLATEAPKRV